MMRDFVIAIGQRANSKKWTNKKVTWEQLCEKLSKTIVTSESVEEYKHFVKEAKQEAKDHGGFVGGKLRDGQRLKNNVEYRSLVTLDIDDAVAGFLQKFLDTFPYTCSLYSTHGHRDDSPRFRVIIPLSRDVDGDEYVAISRLLANEIGIEQVDPVSFSVNQLMYWPSTPSDGNFIYRNIEKTILNPEDFLANYPNWNDLTSLPKKEKETHVNSGKPGRKQADPLEHDGIVGAFCRAYGISEAIETFLTDIYEDAGNNRYHLIGSSSVAGAINYDDKFFYSHHANDVAVGQTLNSFNLVKIHLFGDDKAAFKKMCDFARNDEKVKSQISDESIQEARKNFDEDVDLSWMKKLSKNDDGEIQNTVNNLVIILENDEQLKDIAYNTLAGTAEVIGVVPWTRVGSTKFWRDGDTSQLKVYVERHYASFSDRNFEIAFSKVTEDRAFNPVKQYLDNLPKWDGIKRVEDLFIKYLDADNNNYTREVTRKWFAAAVARIYKPGIKFDNIIVLDGKQEIFSNYGRSSHEENPFVFLKNLNNEETIGFNLIYSGNFKFSIFTSYNNTPHILYGINDEEFTWLLKAGESFVTPQAVISYSNSGIDRMSQNFHNFIRKNIITYKHNDVYKPILFNDWEGAMFNCTTDVISNYAEKAKEIGAELFVLDDGWFGHRDSDNSSLGDWTIYESKIDFAKVTKKIHDLGMKFGLWFEPEMISVDSNLYKKHPEYALGSNKKYQTIHRHQLVLDFSSDEVIENIYNQMINIIEKYKIDYLKWDHNRSLFEHSSVFFPKEQQGEIFHRNVLGYYKLLEKISRRYPDMMIEGCASGGGRFDLGTLYYTPQIWASDNTDPKKRIFIQYSTSLGYPLSTIGSHASNSPSASYKTKSYLALFGTYGYEMNPNNLSEQERNDIKAVGEIYKKYHTNVFEKGTLYHLKNPVNSNYFCLQTVSQGKKTSAFLLIKLNKEENKNCLIKLKGLDENLMYFLNSSNVSFTGKELMNNGLDLSKYKLDSQLESIFIILETK